VRDRAVLWVAGVGNDVDFNQSRLPFYQEWKGLRQIDVAVFGRFGHKRFQIGERLDLRRDFCLLPVFNLSVDEKRSGALPAFVDRNLSIDDGCDQRI